MRMLFGLVFVVGLVLAGFAAKLVQGQLAKQEAVLQAERQAAAQRAEVVEIYALAKSVAYGDEIRPSDIGKIQYAKQFLPAGTFTTLEEIFPEGEDIPRMALRPMDRMEPLLASKVTAPGDTTGLVTRLGAGMRAFALRTNVSSGVSGFLRPGDRVDVYWTGTPPGGTVGSVTKLIDSAVEILAVDQTDNQDLSGARVARTVTVRVSVHQVAALAQAQATGQITLALVGLGDEGTTEEVEVDQIALLGIEKAAPVEAAPAPKVCTVRQRRGGELVETVVPCSE